jgi:hypothetical protein
MDPARSSDPGQLSFDAWEQKLCVLPRIRLIGLLNHSSNYTYLARLGDGAEEVLIVYKPAAGESPLWDFEPDTLYRREVAAYRLARALGWPRIPPTVIREDAPHGTGAVQLFINGDPRNHFLRIREQARLEWPRIALFDVLTNNADRKAGHCMMDAAGRVWVFDHGLTFHSQPKLRTVIWDYAGQDAPADLLNDVERVEAQLENGPLAHEFGELLARSERRTLRRRFQEVLSPGWRFPYPTSSWSLPWPPI